MMRASTLLVGFISVSTCLLGTALYARAEPPTDPKAAFEDKDASAPGDRAQEKPGAYSLFVTGKTAEAKARYESALRSAEVAVREYDTATARRRLWDALIALAWFLDETGEHRQAIEHSNRALEIAASANDRFMLGRSLSWLGWGYSELGLYETAQQFYSEALSVAAPKGVPEIIPVWGLSKQELGYLFFKMGDLANGKKFLEETTAFARTNRVLIGVAEGSVRLAEIAVHEGNLGQATAYATEARDAAEKCGCTPFTLAHAKTELAAIAVEKATREGALFADATKAVEDALAEATKLGIKRFVAECRLLQAKLIPAQDFERRYDVVREAFETLSNMESERRGDAEAAMGKVFLDEANTELATFYLKHGVEVNDAMLRNFNKAYVLRDMAHLDGIRGESQQVLNKLQDSADRALSSGALPAAVEAEEQLFRELSRVGYTSVAAKWGKQALRHLDTMIEKETDEHQQSVLKRKRLSLVEELSTDTLKILPLPTGQP